jgi:hypothetical protein
MNVPNDDSIAGDEIRHGKVVVRSEADELRVWCFDGWQYELVLSGLGATCDIIRGPEGTLAGSPKMDGGIVQVSLPGMCGKVAVRTGEAEFDTFVSGDDLILQGKILAIEKDLHRGSVVLTLAHARNPIVRPANLPLDDAKQITG